MQRSDIIHVSRTFFLQEMKSRKHCIHIVSFMCRPSREIPVVHLELKNSSNHFNGRKTGRGGEGRTFLETIFRCNILPRDLLIRNSPGKGIPYISGVFGGYPNAQETEREQCYTLQRVQPARLNVRSTKWGTSSRSKPCSPTLYQTLIRPPPYTHTSNRRRENVGAEVTSKFE